MYIYIYVFKEMYINVNFSILADFLFKAWLQINGLCIRYCFAECSISFKKLTTIGKPISIYALKSFW